MTGSAFHPGSKEFFCALFAMLILTLALGILATRQRERRMQGFKSPAHAQRFLPAYGPIAQHFRPRRHLLPAPQYRHEMGNRFHAWQEITSLPTAA